MAKPKGSSKTQEHREPIKKKTSIGHGKRKRGSLKGEGRYRGQGKG